MTKNLRGNERVARAVRSFGAIFATLLLASPATAGGPGSGIRFADHGLITPTLDVGMQFQSNPFLVDGGGTSPDRQVVRGVNLLARPQIKLEVNNDVLLFDLTASLAARQFLNKSARNLSRATDSTTLANLELLPDAVVGLKLSEDFYIDNRPSEARFAGLEDNTGRPFVTQVHTGSDAWLAIHPGGALNIDVGGFFDVDDFSTNPNSTPSPADDNNSGLLGADLNNRWRYGPQLNVKWAFFPKTSLLASAEFERFSWENNLIQTTGGTALEFTDDWLAMPDGLGFRVNAGLSGRFTKKIVLNTTVGYGQLRYDTASVEEEAAAKAAAGVQGLGSLDAVSQGWDASLSSFGEGLLVTSKLAWAPRKNQTFSLGYVKDYQDSWFTNYVSYHYGFLRYEGKLSRRLTVNGNFGYRMEKYRGHVTRDDQVTTLMVGGTYSLQNWVAVSVDTGWNRRVSCPDGLCANGNEDSRREYDNVPVNVLFTFSY